jgi:nicotinamidase-related amidase
MKCFLPALSCFAAANSPPAIDAILRRASVFHQAGCGGCALTGYVRLAHDPVHKRTASGAVFRGMNVIVPVDGLSAAEAYADLASVFMFMNAPQVSAKATLTKTDMIKF